MWSKDPVPLPTGSASALHRIKARDSDVIAVHALNRLASAVRDVLHLLHDLSDRGSGDVEPGGSEPNWLFEVG